MGIISDEMSVKKPTQPPIKPQTTDSLAKPAAETVPQYSVTDPRFWFLSFRGQAIIVALLAFVLYCNTFYHEFAHDDGIVIVKNEFVLKGTAGIKDIMTKDAYHSYYRQLNTTNQLKGGRFRPLSIITFALEQQFLGAVPEEAIDSVLKQQISYGVAGPTQKKLISNMHVRHVFNVLWYMLSVVVLLYFLRFIVFNKYPVAALVAAVLFTVHPVHTEVVANVKSRDEIMSLLFMCLTFIYAFRYEDDKKRTGMLAAAMLTYLLAFLSKEYAVTVLVLLPMALVIFRGYSILRSVTAILPYLVVLTVYFAVRLNAISLPLEDNEKISESTKSLIAGFPLIGTILAGVGMFFFVRNKQTNASDMKTLQAKALPFIPYFLLAFVVVKAQFAALPEVIASAAQEVLNNPYLYAEGVQKSATIISSSLYYIKFLLFPHPLSADYSFAQIPYKDFSHYSVWLSIAVHLGMVILMFVYLPKKQLLKSVDKVTVGGKEIICFAIGFYFLHLIMVNNFVFDIGATLGERLIYHSSVGFAIVVAWLLVKGSEKLKPAANGALMLGVVVGIVTVLMGFKTIDRNKAWKNDSMLFTTDIKTVPNSVLVNANVAASYITMADYAETPQRRQQYLTDAIAILDHTLDIHPRFVAAYLNRGIAWYKVGDIDKAIENLNSVKRLYPTYPTLPGMYKLICDHYLRVGWEQYGKNGKFTEAIEVYKKGLQVDSTNADLWYNIGGAYYTNRRPVEALEAFRRTLQLAPNNQQAQMGIRAASEMLSGAGQPNPQTNK